MVPVLILVSGLVLLVAAVTIFILSETTLRNRRLAASQARVIELQNRLIALGATSRNAVAASSVASDR